jgi:nicotinate-nucleotide pyrophosphorylase (carboxylating)
MITKSQVYENLRNNGLEPELIQSLVDLAISEDLMGESDITSLSTIPETQISELDLVSRKSGVIAGIDVASLVLLSIGQGKIEINQKVKDGQKIDAQTCILTAKGPSIDLLTAERTALNFLSHLSGIATITNKWVEEVADTKAKIRDTRKTTPGLRVLEKYAVRVGGGINHRMSLSDQALIKDNHIVAAGSITKAIQKVTDKYPEKILEVEVDNLSQLNEVLELKVSLILLDNFSLIDLSEAVKVVNGKVKLEASGGITFENAHKIAVTGVDYLAVGALTHSAPVLDIGGDLRTVS